MNEKESQQLKEKEEINSVTDHKNIDTQKLSQVIPPPSNEIDTLSFIGKVNAIKQNVGLAFVGNINPTESEALREPGGLIRKCGYRYKPGIGPPPRPFKKARYAWEIKNYEHTLSNMNQNLGESSAPLLEDSQDSQSSDINSEGSQEDGPDPLDGLSTAGIEGINSKCFMVPRTRTRTDMMAPIMPAPYPTTYGMMAAPPPPIPSQQVAVDGSIQEPPQMPPDPDARILRWHTRQLCRSIFDNTVNRMLENMGFSPVTERSQGIHPLLVLSLSDDEEREAEEAQQRALENQALSAAMHQKGLFLPPYHYDPLESATTTDYDSSEDDSDLGEEAIPEDLQQDGNGGHIHMSHMVSRPLPRVPHMPPMPAMAGMPLMPNPHLVSSMTHHHHPHPGAQVHNTLNLNNIPTALATNPSPTMPGSPISNQLKEVSCDGKDQNVENGNNIVNNNEIIDSNKNVLVVEKDTCLKKEEIEMNETKSGLNSNDNEMERKSPFIVENEEPKTKTDNENNNDKFFVDQAIQMAIKQQGLGFQHA